MFSRPFNVSLYFVNDHYVTEEPVHGHRYRINVSRNPGGVGGLTQSFEPCVCDADIARGIELHHVNSFSFAPTLDQQGFEYFRWWPEVISFFDNEAELFPPTLSDVLNTGASESYRHLRSLLVGSFLPLSNGLGLMLASEGIIVRKVLPLGQSAEEGFGGGARAVHIDQDILGFPLTSFHLPFCSWASVSNLLFYFPFFRLVNIWFFILLSFVLLLAVNPYQVANCPSRGHDPSSGTG